ncbi:Vinc [Bugula neritina]|uniref:Vinculin n=1 Tax=Bugula neritina TaxID=10212 RepID=A0A7J7KSI7_BUGNE|nr:Vinc [Bugula neritina]
MPVFHTKTIESILEPVAQQVSRLVILHEEAEDGNAMPDLSQSVATVKHAVDNLIQIGYETVNTSDDSILKQDMPPALQRVEEAATSLLEASNMLKEDPFFAPARKKLINGSRGILQGTSALLLAFDESEVRKIIAQCRRVLEYIGITEVIESMDDLVTFVKNISPGLTRMTKQVDDREKELTHQVHKDILLRCLEEIKVLTPVLISGIKTYIQLLSSNSPSSADAKNNRDHTCKALGVEIEEIIRVLQLTSAGEDDIEADDAAILKNVLNEMEQRQQEAHDWLRDTQSLPGASGEKALHDMLASALVAAGRCPNPRDAEVIKKTVSDVQSMVNALNELRASGQGDSVQAQALAKGIEEKLADLKSLVLQASSSAEKSGAKQLAHTLKSQIEAALRWLRNPAAFDHGYGEQATRAIIADGRRLAATLPPGKDRDQLLKLCNDAEVCVNQLSDLCHRGMGGTPQAKAVARALAEKLNELSESMTSAVAEKVVEDFLDIGGPLKALTAAATAPLETPHREAIFQEKADQFQGHSRTLVETGKIAAANSGVQTKHSIEAVNKTAKQLADLSPMVVTSAKVVLMNPGQEAAVEHFNLVKQQWADNVEKLKTLMDENTDTQSFMKATEAAILSDTSRIEEAIVTADSQAIVDNAANIARRSNRILQVAQQEVDNSEDPLFQQELKLASDKLKAVVPQMVKNAKSLTLNPRSSQHGQNWRKENDVLVDCVRGIRLAVTPKTHPHPPPLSPYAAQADISQLSLDDVRDGAPPRPPLPGDSNDLAAPPRPPLPVDPDAEMERVFQQQPQENQPIMLAAHTLHQEVKHWESADNELVTAAKQMALLMAKLSSLVRGEGGSKKELIDTARKVAEQSAVVTKLAKGLAAECTDRRMRTNLLQVCERIPTIGTQLKILCTVKATMLGAQGSQEDDEATEMLVGNAQNLMQSVRDTVRAAEGASIKIRVQSGYSLRWVRRRPWYT